MNDLKTIKKLNDISRFISLLDESAIEKLENFIIAENLEVPDEKCNPDNTLLESINWGDDTVLTEEVQNKIKVIFDAVVDQKVNNLLKEQISVLETKVDDFITENQDKVDSYAEYVKEQLEESYKEKAETLNEQIENYLDYVVSEWVEENKLAIDTGIKVQISESVISGLKNLFESNYIDVPEDRINLIGELESKVESLLESNVRLNNQLKEKDNTISELKKIQIRESITKELTDLQKDKLELLASSVKSKNLEDYTKQLLILKESLIIAKPESQGTLLTEETMFSQGSKENSAPVDPKIQSYLDIFTKKR